MNKIIDIIGNMAGHAVSGFIIGVIASMAQALALTPDLQVAILLMVIGSSIAFLKAVIDQLEEILPKSTAAKGKKPFRAFFGI